MRRVPTASPAPPTAASRAPPPPRPAMSARPCPKVPRTASPHRSSPVELELTLLAVAGPPPATVAPPHRGDAAAEPDFFSSPSTRSSGELAYHPSCPAGSLTVVGARPPPLAPSPPLWRRRRPRRAHGSGDRSGVRHAAPRHHGPHWPRPAQRAQAAPAWPWAVRLVAAGRARVVRVGRADATGVGQVPLCIWVERGFGPEALKLIFLFSDLFNLLQIQKFV
jgi:hypothetical protein